MREHGGGGVIVVVDDDDVVTVEDDDVVIVIHRGPFLIPNNFYVQFFPLPQSFFFG